MAASLIEELKKVRDFRTRQGQRHPLSLVLLVVIMGTMSGCVGYRGLGDFVKRHEQSLIEILEIPKKGDLGGSDDLCIHRSCEGEGAR